MNKLAFVVLLAGSATAFAGPKEQSKDLVAKATSAFANGRFEDALADLQTAYKLTPKPELLYAIGQANAKLGRCDDAKTAFEAFRKASNDPSVAKVVEEAIAECKPRQPEAAATRPEPPPAEPEPNPVAPPPDNPQPAPQPPPANPPPAVDRGGTTGTVTADAPPAVHTTSSRPWYANPVGDALVVGGILAGVIALVAYNSATSDLNQAETAKDLPTYNQLVNSAHGDQTASIVIGSLGGVAVVAGILYYVHARGASTSVAIAPTSSGGLVTWAGQF